MYLKVLELQVKHLRNISVDKIKSKHNESSRHNEGDWYEFIIFSWWGRLKYRATRLWWWKIKKFFKEYIGG
jgi:hypothetical protein